MICLRFILSMLLTTTTVSAGVTGIYSSHSFPYYSPTTYPYGSDRSRSRRSLYNSNNRRSLSNQNYAVAALVAKNKKSKKKSTSFSNEPEALRSSNPVQDTVALYDDLGPVGKFVAGSTQILVTTALEYVGGFFAGLFLGTVIGLPGFLFKPLEQNEAVKKVLMTEFKGRFTRMNTRSMSWGKSWGGISACFGGFKTAVTVIRGGKEDDWNQILSSAAAGAFFARAGK